MTTYIALEQLVTGAPAQRDATGKVTAQATTRVIEPGEEVTGLDKDEAERLIALGAIAASEKPDAKRKP